MDRRSGFGECFLTSGKVNIGLGLPPLFSESNKIPVRPVCPGTGVGGTGSGCETTETGAMGAENCTGGCWGAAWTGATGAQGTVCGIAGRFGGGMCICGAVGNVGADKGGIVTS